MGSYEKLYFNTGVVKLFYKYGWQEFHISNVYIFNIRFLFVCLGFFPLFQKEEKKEDSFADILELSTHTEQDHRSQRFSVWFTVSQPLQPLFIKKNSNLQQTNPRCESSQFDSAENKQTN